MDNGLSWSKYEVQKFDNNQPINLDQIAKELAQEFDKHDEAWSSINKIYFVNNENKVIHVVNPSQVTNGEYPVYARVTNINGENIDDVAANTDTEVQPKINSIIKPTVNNESFKQMLVFSTTHQILPATTFWSIFPQYEYKLPDAIQNLEYSRYTPATASYIKALITTGLPMVKIGNQSYYLELNPSINDASIDDFDKLADLFKPENKANLEK